MTIRQVATALGAGAIAAVVLLAVVAIWLVLSDPVAVAGVVGDGDVSALAMAFLKLLGRQLVRLVFGR